ncbi:MAG TPA: hypothetical protein VNZ52_07815 [Candidatus Thermoplasmatota archaeon]|nr:hypothetical protein [Candidatus Thermoplasmatota archaeon]
MMFGRQAPKPAPEHPDDAYRAYQRRLFAEAVEDAACALHETYQRTGQGLRSNDALLALATAFFEARCSSFDEWREHGPAM